MKLRLAMTTVMLAATVFSAPPASQKEQPVGMVLRSKGEVVLQRSGAKRPVQLADLLYPEDTVMVVTGEASILFCPAATTYRLGVGSSLKLAKDLAVGAGETVENAPSSRRCALPEVALGAESLERAGAIRVRSSGLPAITLYLGGPISSPRPRFSWKGIDQAERYRVTVRDEQGVEVWQFLTRESAADYPEDLAPLRSGLYEWQVEGLSGERTIAQQTTRFVVDPNPDLAALDGSGPEALLNAVTLENSGYYSEAAAIFRALRQIDPNDERIAHHLAWLYSQAGLSMAASEEL